MIPSNAPAIGVQRTLFGDVAVDGGIEYRTGTAAALVLRRPDGGLVTGQAVEAELGTFVATPLVEGPWSVQLDEGCPVDAGFVVGPPAPLPAVSATVSLVETIWFPEVSGSTCNDPMPARQVARLRIEPSVEMRPWLPLARWEVEVDGANVRTSGFGNLSALPLDRAPNEGQAVLNGFDVQCGGATEARYLQPGRHEVKVIARILGVTDPIQSSVLEVDVKCDPPSGCSCTTVTGLEFFAVMLVWMRRRRSLSSASKHLSRMVLLVGLVSGSGAWACSGLTCEAVVVRVPKAGSTIPSNAPAVGVQLTVFSDVSIDGGIEHPQTTTTPFSLRGPDGGLVMGPRVESALGVFVATTLVEGAWSMSLDDSSPCFAGSGFAVGPPAPLPAVAGTVSLVETLWFPSAYSGCTGPYPDQQIARLRIEASPEMVPWLPLVRWEVLVDGSNVTTSGFGRVSDEPFDPTPNALFRTFNSIAVQCGEALDGGTADGGPAGVPDARYLRPGLHEVKVLARILGVSAPIPTNTLQVNLVCTPPPAEDAGTIATEDAGSTPTVDAGSVADGGSTAGPPPSGCSAVTGLELFALLLVWMRRRVS
ncbi:MAG: hypothetical protein Q8K32_09635 [Archangium sp.]|nr:hypothetical protein [Archangium sp.]